MKTQITYIIFLIYSTVIFGQVGIGTTNPDSNAILDISSTNKGVLFPRLNKSQMDAIVDNANNIGESVTGGLTVFCTDCCVNRPEGSLFFYNGTDWVSLDNNCKNTNFPDCVNITTIIDESTHIKQSSIPLFFDGYLTEITQPNTQDTKFHRNKDDQVTFTFNEPIPIGGKFVMYWSDEEPGNLGFEVLLFNSGSLSQAPINTVINMLPNSTNISNGSKDYILTITLIAESDAITVYASPGTNHPKLVEVKILDDNNGDISSNCN